MRLIDALRTKQPTCLAFVGAGGKTSALFRVAREIVSGDGQESTENRSVLVTTSTHLGSWQADLADHAYKVNRIGDLEFIRRDIPSGVILITGEENNQLLSGLHGEMLDDLYRIAVERQLTLLIEADGAHGCPLKAPDEYEPAIPGFTEQVIVVTGLSGLGKPLTKEWVHRENIFGRLSGIQPGEEVSEQGLVNVLLNKQGGLKNIPSRARRCVLLNQADTLELQAQAREMAKQLIGVYDGCVIASLLKEHEALPLNNDLEARIHAVIERTAGIILAAGGSSRFGKPKQLLLWKGQAMIRHVAITALQAGLNPVVVVIGASAAEVEPVIEDLPLRIVNNTTWEDGSSTSIKKGIGSLTTYTGGVVFLQADQPQIPASLIKKLLEAHQTNLSPIIAPQINGQRGNPVLFDRSSYSKLLGLEGDMGGRTLFAHYAVQWVNWPDPRVLIDVDTPEDYKKLLRLYAREEEQA
jgi:molybdenum cofactor cytidylyltransferase